MGKARSRGIDFSGKIQHAFNKDLWVILNGTLTYNKVVYKEIEEAMNKPAWQSMVGKEISQKIGYISDGLFQDQAEIENAPVQAGSPQPGDIRYRDLNNDGKIDVNDVTYIGFPENPRVTYGFSGFVNYRNFEFSFAFQGSGKRSFFMDPSELSPFVDDHAMLTAIYKDHWSEDNMIRKPFWPRLSTQNLIEHSPEEDWYNKNATEVRKSTYFMRECRFLRCTSLELAYNMPKKLMVGKVAVGGGAPVSIQSMCNTKTDDVAATVAQIHALEDAGCEIIRVAVPDEDAAKAVDKIKEQIDIPLIADIHFNYKLALMCAERGIDALRINPGNIGGEEKVKAVADICRQKNIPIRIGVNGGSLEKHILAKYGAPVPEAMVESALYHVRLLEKFDFNNIVISIKNSNVPRMMEAYRQLSAVTDYPLHVGVTEAGTYQMGLLKSGMGIGGMLLEGIGDTIRVSLAAEPEKEVEAGYNILRAVGFPVAGPEVITCPTCGRTQYPCTQIANEVEKRLQGCKKSIKVAVMGCVVNGPGEAREADIGIAGGKGEAVLFIHGKPIKKLTGDNILDQFMDEIYKL